MLIGSQYADNKMYRGIKHYDSMPLTSGDIHEYSDTEYMKNAYIMNNLLGYGTMNTPQVLITEDGLYLTEPSVVMIEGDVSLIQSDTDKPFVPYGSIQEAQIKQGTVFILGWYQSINASSKLRNYGGVDNSELPNDLMNPKFKVQISSRYQLRWFPLLLSNSDSLESEVTIEIKDRDRDGNLLDTTTQLQSYKKINNTFFFEKPTSMSYAESDLYLVPILNYEFDTPVSCEGTTLCLDNLSDKVSIEGKILNLDDLQDVCSLSEGELCLDDLININSAVAVDKLRAGLPFISDDTEPEGVLPDGTRWYNPTTREFKTYVSESGGFVDSASKMAFLQYQSVHIITESVTTPQDVVIPINISQLEEGDVIRVIYDGLELAVDLQYTIDYDDNTLTLLNYTTKTGDLVYITVTKIVEATDITNVTETFVRHMASRGSGTVEAHVKLSDTESSLGVNDGTAATPYLVNSVKNDILDQIDQLEEEISAATILTDESTSKKYKLGVKDGQLYIEEV